MIAYALTNTRQSEYSLSALIRLQKARNSNFNNSLRDCGKRAPVSLSRGGLFLLMKKIPLTQGKYALVDDQDYEFLSQWKWHAVKYMRNQTIEFWYARRSSPRPNKITIHMHREVLLRAGFSDFPQCDHIDSDGLNNQRHNLRPATVNQNGCNRIKRNGCSSRFKGVHWHKSKGVGWMATIFHEGKLNYLGTFENETEAAKAYDAAAIRIFGQFAKLNFL